MSAGAGAEQQADRVAGRLVDARAELVDLERRVAEKRSQITRLESQQHAWSQGGEGERVVGAELDAMLADGWQVLHDVHWPGRPRANLDHVVVGPGGVVVVDAKNWAAQVTVRAGVLRAGGHRKDGEIQDALAQCAAVAALLPARFRSTASSVVCFVQQDLDVHSLRGVAVLSRVELRQHLLSLPEVLAPVDVAALSALLRHQLGGARTPSLTTTARAASGGGTHEPTARARRAGRPRAPRPSGPPVRRRVRPAFLKALAVVVLVATAGAWLPAVSQVAESVVRSVAEVAVPSSPSSP